MEWAVTPATHPSAALRITGAGFSQTPEASLQPRAEYYLQGELGGQAQSAAGLCLEVRYFRVREGLAQPWELSGFVAPPAWGLAQCRHSSSTGTVND